MENEMTKEEIIEILLGIKESPNRKSCLMMAYNSAEALSTGACIEEFGCIEAEYFSSLILYLIFLEQVGNIFKVKNKNVQQRNGIKRALLTFTNISDDDANAIAFLRNTFAHNFGLATNNVPTKEERKTKKFKNNKYKFTLSLSGNMIEHAAPKWDNNYKDKTEETSTKINVRELIKLIDTVHDYLITNYKSLEIRIGIEQIKTRFTIRI